MKKAKFTDSQLMESHQIIAVARGAWSPRLVNPDGWPASRRHRAQLAGCSTLR